MEVDILNIPKLRFKEFTDEWIYYKYKDIFKLNQGLQIPITERFLDYAPNRFFYITNEFLKLSSKKSYYIENPSPNVICTKEDILMTRTGNTGKVITNIAGVFHNNFFRIKYNPKNFNKDFICCILNQNKIQNKILTLAGSSTIPDLNHKDFYSIKSRFPKLKEQEKIAKFINTVDKKIENIENTISSLENQKKGLLQQIFSQKLRFKDENGNNYPELEKKKLDEYVFIYDGIHQTPKYTNSGIKFVSVENIHDLFNTNKFISEKDFLKEFKNIPTVNDILMTRIGDVGTATLVTKDEPLAYYVSLALFKQKKTIYMPFLLHYISTTYFQHELWKRTLHIAFPKKINKNEIGKCNLLVPCLEEQTKIADFLSAFDRKLENQKVQLEHWQQIKKGLLQQMFV